MSERPYKPRSRGRDYDAGVTLARPNRLFVFIRKYGVTILLLPVFLIHVFIFLYYPNPTLPERLSDNSLESISQMPEEESSAYVRDSINTQTL